MRRTILVPLDGSKFAEKALPVAADFARAQGAGVELVLVSAPPAPVVPGPGAPADVPFLGAVPREHWEQYLDGLTEELLASGGASVTTTVLEGRVVETLEQHIRRRTPALVVMTTHGRGGLSRAWLGSVADGLARRVSVPLLLLRPDAANRPFRHVLIPLDGSDVSERIVDAATELAGADGVRYTLLRVLATGVPGEGILPRRGSPPSGRSQQAMAEALLARTAESMASRGFDAHTRVIVADDAARQILDWAGANGVDLIAMVTQSQGGLERVFLGSVADKVLRGSTNAVLLVNPRAVQRGVRTEEASAATAG